MRETGRQQALDAALIAYRHLQSAVKHLSGHRIPLAGVHYDLGSAMKELRVVQARTSEAIVSIEPHVPME